MKKQLLIAAVAASMTSVAMADISISGGVKMNSADGAYSHEADMTITGKSGDTSVTANISLDDKGVNQNAGSKASINVEDLYMTTAVAGVKVKMGGWRSGKSELGGTSGTVTERVNVSTSFGGLSLAYEDTGSANSTTVGGSLAGVAVSHKMSQNKDTETKASGSIGGVSVKVHSKGQADGSTDTSTVFSTEIQGVTLTYAKTTSDDGTAQDGYIGSGVINANSSADAIGVKTSISGNTVQFKNITINSADSNKVIVTRGLGAGATFEATYTDTATTDTLDLELAVKF